MNRNNQQLEDLPNIGPILAAHLHAVGIHTSNELREIGSREAFLRIKERRDPGACLSMLCGLEGAIQGIRHFDLPRNERQALKEFHHDHR